MAKGKRKISLHPGGDVHNMKVRIHWQEPRILPVKLKKTPGFFNQIRVTPCPGKSVNHLYRNDYTVNKFNILEIHHMKHYLPWFPVRI